MLIIKTLVISFQHVCTDTMESSRTLPPGLEEVFSDMCEPVFYSEGGLEQVSFAWKRIKDDARVSTYYSHYQLSFGHLAEKSYIAYKLSKRRKRCQNKHAHTCNRSSEM